MNPIMQSVCRNHFTLIYFIGPVDARCLQQFKWDRKRGEKMKHKKQKCSFLCIFLSISLYIGLEIIHKEIGSRCYRWKCVKLLKKL